MTVRLLDLATLVRSWGRGVVFYADGWSPGTVLSLTHLGDTEGDIKINTNPAMAGLTTPELTGPAVHEMDYTGEAPTMEIPLWLADPALIAVCTPTGLSSGGRSRRSAPKEYTLVIFPEAIFLKADNTGVVDSYDVEWTGGAWTLDGTAFTAAQQTLLGTSFWAWRGVFTTPPRTFHGGAGDARKQIETVTFSVLHHPDTPEGHHLYTTGDPFDVAGLDIEGGS